MLVFLLIIAFTLIFQVASIADNVGSSQNKVEVNVHNSQHSGQSTVLDNKSVIDLINSARADAQAKSKSEAKADAQAESKSEAKADAQAESQLSMALEVAAIQLNNNQVTIDTLKKEIKEKSEELDSLKSNFHRIGPKTLISAFYHNLDVTSIVQNMLDQGVVRFPKGVDCNYAFGNPLKDIFKVLYVVWVDDHLVVRKQAFMQDTVDRTGTITLWK